MKSGDEHPFERLIADISGRFLQSDAESTDAEIEHALAAIGESLEVDRCFTFLASRNGSRHRASHVWTGSGIAPDQEVIGQVMQDAFPWVGAKMLRQEDIVINRLEELPPEAKREMSYCRDHGIQSFLMCPMHTRKMVVGNIGVDSIRRRWIWTDDDLRRVRLVGEIIANGILRQRKDREIEKLKQRLEAENLYLRDEIELKHSHAEIFGDSTEVKSMLVQVEQVAETDTSVLILGETGTGKELLAKAIHRSSPRRDRPLISVNCAALSPTLIESELFGREKGAYTGAIGRQIGRFEVADGSTLFLDEVGELPLELQAKLLRVLQSGEFERLGSPKTIRVDVRVIAATNRDLFQAVGNGAFRNDLFYRLNVFPITVPSLRDRRDDIPLLVWTFVREFEQTIGRHVDHISTRSMNALKAYSWPGNVRELRNIIERAMILCRGGKLIVDLPLEPGTSAAIKPLKTLAETECDYITSVLDSTGWRVSGERGAAKILGLKPTTLESRMKKLGIKRPQDITTYRE